MTDNSDELLEELNPDEFKEFTDRVDAFRQKRGVKNFTQGVQPMNDNFQLSSEQIERAIAELKAKNQTDPEEQKIIEEAAEQARQKIEARRMQPQIDAYKAEMLAARGKGQRVGEKIKARYRAQGVPVDSISFVV